MLEPVVVAGAGLASFVWYHGVTVSHHLVGMHAKVIVPFNVDVALSFYVIGSLWVRRGFSFGSSVGFGIGLPLSYHPGFSSWRYSALHGLLVSVSSAVIQASCPAALELGNRSRSVRPDCGPGFDPEQSHAPGTRPEPHSKSAGAGPGWNQAAVLFSGFYNCHSNHVF